MLQSLERDYSEHLFKVLIIGEPATGKTSFIKRYVHNFFSTAYQATIGIDFAIKSIQFDEQTSVRLQLWDVAGQERFSSLARPYYKNSDGAFLALDINRPNKYKSALIWKNDLDARVSLSDGSNIPCFLLVTRSDLIKRADEDEERRLNVFVRENGFLGWLYTSAKDNLNIEEANRLLVREMLRRQEDSIISDLSKHQDPTRVMELAQNHANNKGSCCQ